MTFSARVVLAATMLVAGAPLPAMASDDSSQATASQSSGSATVSGDLLKDWQALKDTMVKLGEAMPPDKFSYKATPELRTFAEQLMHVAAANVGLMKLVDPKATPPTLPEKPTDKAVVMKALADSFDFGAAALKGKSDTDLQATVEGPRFLGPSTAARVTYRAMGHTWDEYGVMTVYLRLNGIVPPASAR
jgi:hypothetical protein